MWSAKCVVCRCPFKRKALMKKGENSTAKQSTNKSSSKQGARTSTTYYLVYGKYLGKGVKGEKTLAYYLYKDGEWVKDTGFVISDLLHGFDPSEPAGSSYGYGSTDIMREVKTISAEEAQERIKSGNYSEPDNLPTLAKPPAE